MGSLNQQQGFTLIELVMVIVILSVLAAVALPRFSSMQQDTRYAALKNTRGAVITAMNIVYAKSLIEDEYSLANASIELDNGIIVNTVYGYPARTEIGIAANIDVSNGPFWISFGGGVLAKIYLKKFQQCKFFYFPATSTTVPARVGALPAISNC